MFFCEPKHSNFRCLFFAKSLIIFCAIFAALSACSETVERRCDTSKTVDTGQAPESPSFYFTLKSGIDDGTPNRLDSFLNTWFSTMLFALREPKLNSNDGNEDVYRFTWLRSFHNPVALRLEEQCGHIKLFYKVCNGSGGYAPGRIVTDTVIYLTPEKLDSLNCLLNSANFWNMETVTNDAGGTDGAVWIMEGIKSGKYHLVVRHSPDKGSAFRIACEYLRSLTPLKQEMMSNPESDY